MSPQSISEPIRKAIDPNDLDIAYVGGGSREWAPKLVQDLALSELSGTVRLYDTDEESARVNERFGNWVRNTQDTRGSWAYKTVPDLGAALSGADVVVLSTQFDPRETFVHDLRIPKKYGIYGAVSATIGPGGIFRAMRTIPVYREFAATIRDHCPDAYVLNFTNPVHFVTRALYDEYPDINAVGLCHEVLGTRAHLAALAEEHLGLDDVSREEVTVNVKGINHFTWIDEASCRGYDLWPTLEELRDSQRAHRRFTPDDLSGESPFVDNWQVTWELFRRFDVLPAAGDRHLVEYATWFLQGGKEGLNRWGVKRTDAEFRSEHWTPSESDQTTDVTARMDDPDGFELEASGETFAEVLEALAGLDTFVTNVNLPNAGQLDGIESDVIVETNALVRAGELRPLSAGGFPRPVGAQIRQHIETIETIIEASRTGDLDLAFQGFLLDPQIRGLDTESARDLFGELLAAEEAYFREWAIDGADILVEAETY